MEIKRLWEIVYLLMRSNLVLLALFAMVYFLSLKIIPIIDTRHVENGDRIHPGFMVAIYNTQDGTFDLVDISDHYKYIADNNYRLLPSKEHEIMETQAGYSSYTLIEKNNDIPIIQTSYKDSDRETLSTYSVHKNKVISPIKSRIYGFDYMFSAIGIAFIFIAVVYILSYILQLLVRKPTAINSEISKQNEFLDE